MLVLYKEQIEHAHLAQKFSTESRRAGANAGVSRASLEAEISAFAGQQAMADKISRETKGSPVVFDIQLLNEFYRELLRRRD
jgi:hypothetical protein